MAIALSEFRVALGGRSEAFGFRCNNEQQREHRRKTDLRKPHANPLISARRAERMHCHQCHARMSGCDWALIVRSGFDNEILDHSPMQRMSRRQYDCVIHMPSLLRCAKPEQPERGGCHVAQILACDRCRGVAQRGEPGTNPCLCLARRLARWLGLGRRMGSRLESWLGPGWVGPGWVGPGWGWRGWGWGGPRYVVAPGFYGGGCVVRRLVPGPWGPRWILVNRCW